MRRGLGRRDCEGAGRWRGKNVFRFANPSFCSFLFQFLIFCIIHFSLCLQIVEGGPPEVEQMCNDAGADFPEVEQTY